MKISLIGGMAAVVAVLALGLPQSATAEPGKWYINPAIGYQIFDTRRGRDLDDTVTAIFGLEYQINNDWGVEARYLHSSPDSRSGISATEADLYQASVDVLHYLDRFVAPGWKPYLALGVGYAEFNREARANETGVQSNLGGGVRYEFDRNWSIRADVRWLHFFENDMNDAVASLGISYAFGGRRPAPQPAPEPKPEPEPAAEPEPEPEQRITTEVREIRMEIHFPVNSADIPREYLSEVEKVAAFMEQHPHVTALIEGHTDSTGDASYNRQLSQRRADAVKAELVTSFGIDGERVDTVGYGQDRPIADNDTAEGRRMNRRVVAVMQAEVKRVETD